MSELIFRECPNCGARLKIAPGATHCRCSYCDTDFHFDKNVIVDHPGTVEFKGDPDAKSKFSTVIMIAVALIFIIVMISITSVIITQEKRDYNDAIKHDVEQVSIDPFDNITVSFSGINHSGAAKITNNNNYKCSINRVDVDRNYDLSNGEEIVVTVDYNQDKAKENGVTITNISKTYLVSGLYEYISDPEKIDGYLDKLKEYAEAALTDYKKMSMYEYQWTEQKDLTYLGWITLAHKKKSQGKIYLVYKAVYFDEKGSKTIYTPICFKEPIMTADGAVKTEYTANVSSGSDIIRISDNWQSSVYGYESLNLLKDTLITNSKAEWIVNSNISE